jgi:hypothetical protein
MPHSDPDNVVLCLLAADEDDDRDVALQIHFTLIQAFCCENDIDILRVSNPGRLAELLLLGTEASPAASGGAAQPPDLHCVLVTVSHGGGTFGPGVGVCFIFGVFLGTEEHVQTRWRPPAAEGIRVSQQSAHSPYLPLHYLA